MIEVFKAYKDFRLIFALSPSCLEAAIILINVFKLQRDKVRCIYLCFGGSSQYGRSLG